MSIQAIGSLGIIALVVLMFLRIPVAIALLVVGLVGYSLISSLDAALVVMGSTPLQISTEYTMSVVPLFTLMGVLAARMGMSRRIYAAAAAGFGTMRGSSALATLGASAMFGTMNGSSLASCVTVGRIAVPEMRAQGYRDTIIAGSVAAGGTLGILIPPSIIFVVYALITEQSIARLFAAGIIPGFLLTVFYCLAVVGTMSLDSTAAPRGDYASWRDRLRALLGAWEAAILFGVTIGGIYLGFFTPTEAAAVGVALALAIGAVMRTLTLREVLDAIVETTVITAVLFLVLLGATFFSYFVVQARLPQMLVEFLNGAGFSSMGVLMLVIVFYIIAGIVLDGIGLVLATVPIIYPVMVSMGFDPVWFGVLLVVLVEFGLLSPPVGMNLFVMKTVAPDLSFRDIYVGVLPFLLAQGVLIVLLVMVPQVAMWLPNVLYP